MPRQLLRLLAVLVAHRAIGKLGAERFKRATAWVAYGLVVLLVVTVVMNLAVYLTHR